MVTWFWELVSFPEFVKCRWVWCSCHEKATSLRLNHSHAGHCTNLGCTFLILPETFSDNLAWHSLDQCHAYMKYAEGENKITILCMDCIVIAKWFYLFIIITKKLNFWRKIVNVKQSHHFLADSYVFITCRHETCHFRMSLKPLRCSVAHSGW